MYLRRCFIPYLLIVFIYGSYVYCGEIVKNRPKRYLGFIDKSKYFIRLNTKHNMVPEFRIFAQATGFRWNLETPYGPAHNYFRKIRHQVTKRDLYRNLEQLILQNGFDGKSCIQNAVCEASKLSSNQTGILIQLFKKIFTVPDEDIKDHPHLRLDQCEQIQGTCPLSLLHFSRFTDD